MTEKIALEFLNSLKENDFRNEDGNPAKKIDFSKMPPEVYALYKESYLAAKESFAKEVAELPEKPYGELVFKQPTDAMKGVDMYNFPEVCFDQFFGTKVYQFANEVPQGALTFADGGTMPLALSLVANYFDIDEYTAVDFGKVMTDYGYRKNGVGVLHLILDQIQFYFPKMASDRVSSLEEFDLALADQSKVIFALIDPKLIGITSNTSACVVAYTNAENGRIVLGTTHYDSIFEVDRVDLLKAIRFAWVFEKAK